jgi:DNA (cytosine-5)-methyltransferase 1
MQYKKGCTLTTRNKALGLQKMRPSRSPFTFADIFSGIGGIRLAFERAGGTCVFSSEWDKHAVATYDANFGDVPHGDITKIPTKEIPDFDVLAAGFPCQPFSSFGKREGFLHATQGTLFYDVLRIAKARKPKVIFLENVAGLVTHDGGNTFKTILASLRQLGYLLHWRLLDAKEYGVPQRRSRIYIVGFRKDFKVAYDAVTWPTKSKRAASLGAVIQSKVTDYSISKHLQRAYIYKTDDGKPQVIVPGRADKQIANTLVASYHKIQRLTGTFVADGPTGLRLLTVQECKAIMGFPKSYKMPVSRTQSYRQLGNSVAVPVVAAIANEIVKSVVNA